MQIGHVSCVQIKLERLWLLAKINLKLEIKSKNMLHLKQQIGSSGIFLKISMLKEKSK